MVVVGMPLVFVHGVGNHDKERIAAASDLRNKLFARFLQPAIGAPSNPTMIESPWWGEAAATPRWGSVCRPSGQMARLGGGLAQDSLLRALVAVEPPVGAAGSRTENVVLDTAAQSLADAVDLLYSALDVDSCSPDELEELAELAVPLAKFCRQYERFDRTDPFWGDVGDDQSLITKLVGVSRASSTRRETLGPRAPGRMGRRLKQTAEKLQGAVAAPPTRLAAGGLRSLTDGPVHEFLGDVFKYLSKRGTPQEPGEIIQIVRNGLQEAVRKAPQGEPLVVVAHSMGGDIMYDLASHYCPQLGIDVLMTVGSQVGLFAEFSGFHGIPDDLPRQDHRKVPALPNIKTWFNVVDRSDILSYRAEPVFEGVDDYRYESGAFWAHSAYFRQPNFHARIAHRVKEAIAP